MGLEDIVLPAIDKGIDAIFGGGAPPTTFRSGNQKSQLTLSDPSEMEALLASLSGDAAQQAFGIAGGGGPQGLTQRDILLGNIDPATQKRLDEQAFAGFDEALARAGRVSRGRATASGLPGSSQESEFFGNVANPLISERAMLRAQLGRDELARRTQMRQQILENLQAVQQSPELMRLFQERLATGVQTTKATSREGSEGKVKREELDVDIDARVERMKQENPQAYVNYINELTQNQMQNLGRDTGKTQLELLDKYGY